MLSGMLQQATIMMGESEGSNQLAYSTIPQLELSLERGGERERAREGKINKEAKEAKKERELGREQEGPKEKQMKIEKEIDGRRNIHGGTHKRRQTETLQLQEHVFAETTRNRKGRFGWKDPVGQNRGTSMCVCGELCVHMDI